MIKFDKEGRIFALLLISAVELASVQLLPFVPRDDFYFVACGAFNLLTLSRLSVVPATSLIVDLAKLTFIQLCLQCLGWILYASEIKPYFYNASIPLIVAVTYIRILLTGEYDGNAASNTRWSFIHINACKRIISSIKVHKC